MINMSNIAFENLFLNYNNFASRCQDLRFINVENY